MTQAAPTSKTRADRPFAALNRARWSQYLETPSEQAALLSQCGRATQKRFLKDIAKLMSCLVDNMELRTRKIGMTTSNGFFLYTWETIAKKCDLPLWRVKQCAARVIENGWLESTQPRGMKNGQGEYVCLASIKRVTEKYFDVFGLLAPYVEAAKATTKKLVRESKQWGVAIKYILTPITLLDKFRRRKQAHSKTPPPN
ncbi:hypothetical protein BEL05_04940 [Shewanella colwelliana]|uniref:Replication protein n=1 Tax=Shewanella colwelliana TaxID=23 RepID=A0A1E5IP89_SHECO|nr:hypothetical protein [Shewanella colwelliana]OEG72325.1 hypothetical protein BEL05_04940 [Shewanella colwelliana]